MSIHKPVLLKEAIDYLNLKKGNTVVDATLGGGGHSDAMLAKIGENGKLVAIDMDEEAIERFKSKIKNKKSKLGKNIFLINDNFANLENILKKLRIKKVSAILVDLGWSSDQLKGRGMSFNEDEKLDMRLDKDQNLTAKKIVNEYSQRDLERIFGEYGEEKFFKNIARKITEYRKNKIIETTKELSELVRKAIPKKYYYGRISRKFCQDGIRGRNPATKTFQAIRIEVNQELENLKKFIPDAINALEKKGKLAVISFHSLEDRIAKNIFRENAGGCICPPASRLQTLQEKYLTDIEKKGFSAIDLEKELRAGPGNFLQCNCGKKLKIRIITKKPIVPGEMEIEKNPRARSAKLRVCEKLT
jgi:16S rRNA (cytosine1402-N4)-methyltransferase